MTTDELEAYQQRFLKPISKAVAHMQQLLTDDGFPIAVENYLRAALDNLGHAAAEMVKKQWTRQP